MCSVLEGAASPQLLGGLQGAGQRNGQPGPEAHPKVQSWYLFEWLMKDGWQIVRVVPIYCSSSTFSINHAVFLLLTDVRQGWERPPGMVHSAQHCWVREDAA